MKKHNSINNSHIKALKKYNNRLRELIANSDDYIHMISQFCDNGIAPPEAFHIYTNILSYNLQYFADLTFVVSETITTMEEASIDTERKNIDVWHRLLSISQELLKRENTFSQHTNDYCNALSKSSSLADYWCAQKRPGRASTFSHLSNELSNICTRLFDAYQSSLKQISISLISIAEENIHIISDTIKSTDSWIDFLLYSKNPTNIFSPITSAHRIMPTYRSDNSFHYELTFTPVPTCPGTPVYIHVNEITYQDGTIQYRKLIPSNDPPKYGNIFQGHWEQHTRQLSENEIKKLLTDISDISLDPLYEAMISDIYGATPRLDGASYSILEIRYSDGQHFRFEKHRSIPIEYFNICKTLSSFCIDES